MFVLNKLYQYISNDGKIDIIATLIEANEVDEMTLLSFDNGQHYYLENGQLTLLIQ